MNDATIYKTGGLDEAILTNGVSVGTNFSIKIRIKVYNGHFWGLNPNCAFKKSQD